MTLGKNSILRYDYLYFINFSKTLIYVLFNIQLYYCLIFNISFLQSTDVAVAVYECEWYNLSPEDAKMLLIIIQRARLPFKITAGKFCSFTLVLYSQVNAHKLIN